MITESVNIFIAMASTDFSGGCRGRRMAGIKAVSLMEARSL
jgi:hypothetical protein